MDSFTAAPHNEPKHRCPGMKEGGGVEKKAYPTAFLLGT